MSTLWISLLLIGANPLVEDAQAQQPEVVVPEVVVRDVAMELEDKPDLSIVYTSRRGCFLGGSTHIDAIALIRTVAEREELSFEESPLGIGVYFKDGRYLFPQDNFADPTLVSRILSDNSPLKRKVIERDVPILESEFTTIVQFPRRERRDLLRLITEEKIREVGHDDTKKSVGEIVQYKSPLGTLLALEFPGVSPTLDRDPLHWMIQPSLSLNFSDVDGQSRVLFLGKRQGLPGRIKADFDARVAKANDPIRVYPGNTSLSKEGRCGETLNRFGFDVLTPHRAELELGAKEFLAFQKKHQLNYTVSN